MTWLLLYPLPGLVFWVLLTAVDLRMGNRVDALVRLLGLVVLLAVWPAFIPWSFGVSRGTRF